MKMQNRKDYRTRNKKYREGNFIVNKLVKDNRKHNKIMLRRWKK